MHHVSVISFNGVCAASCSCGSVDAPERYGKNAKQMATYDGQQHLKAVEAEVEKKSKDLEAWLQPTDGYSFINDDGIEVEAEIDGHHVSAECPHCGSYVDCGDGLTFENLYVECDNPVAHELIGYYDGGRYVTFFTGEGGINPFDTTP